MANLDGYKIYRTRYPELGYTRIGSDWRFVAMDGCQPVGSYYPSRTELLADLYRYARDYGCETGPSPETLRGRYCVTVSTRGFDIQFNGRHLGTIYYPAEMPIGESLAYADGCARRMFGERLADVTTGPTQA